MTIKEQNELKSAIKQMVRESLFDLINKNEAKSSEDNTDSDNSEKSVSKNKETRVIQALKSDGVDMAQYAYKLWPDKDKDSARSYFYKCLNKEKNDNGDTYSFNDDEFVKLHSMLTNQQL